MQLNIKQYKILIGATIFWFIFDILTKVWVSSSHFKTIYIIKDWLYFTYQKNSGIAFSIPLPQVIQIIVSIAVLIFLWIFCKNFLTQKRNQFLKQSLFGIIIGGTFGNLYDRVLHGYVIDFIAIGPWPVFNIADVGITIGLILFFLLTLKNNE